MSKVFIDRPILAWVLAIIIMLCGVGALNALPNEQYPDIAPTQVNIRANYPGASAETIENSVTQIIEQQLTGIDGLLYFSSQSSNRGSATITAVFAKGTDPDIAQVQVQNKVQSALARLPQAVQNQGVTVTKANADFLVVMAIYDKTDQRKFQDISDFLSSHLQDPLSRLEGVGEVRVFGAPHAMRIWLDPAKLAAVSLMPSDVTGALTSQNTEVSAGELGGIPAAAGQAINAVVTAGSRLQTPEQFRAVVLKNNSDGSRVTIGDVARVEVGSEDYAALVRVNNHPGAGLAISLSPGADALQTAQRVKDEMARLAPDLPDGLAITYGSDSTEFIKLSVEEVQKSLFEAIVLVVLVMFVFLQSWRATLIPAIAVPIVLLGTFAIFYMAGFSINTLTLFGLVLAIGLLVDDAIVVVENVERLMEENPGMSPREATIRSMEEIQVALVAIALVLCAVFLPMAFFGGSTGVIYRQFSLTIVAAMGLSVLVALILTPAMTASLLKPKHEHTAPRTGLSARVGAILDRFHGWFNATFERMQNAYVRRTERVVEHKWFWLGIYAVVCVVTATMFLRLPTGFLPTEDQSIVMVQWRLPGGTVRSETEKVQREIEKYFMSHEAGAVQTVFTAVGAGMGATGQNTGTGFIQLKNWADRTGDQDNTANAVVARASQAFAGFRNAQVFVLVPGAIRGLGQSSGFTMELQNDGSMTRQQFLKVREQLLAQAHADSRLVGVRLSDLPDVATLKVNTDVPRMTALGVTPASANSTLATAWGGSYVNDYLENGRIKKVYVQGDAPFRSRPEDLARWFVRGSDGQMVPFSSFAQTGWSVAPSSSSRFNGLQAFEISGTPAPGESSGTAMQIMEDLAKKLPGTRVAWSGSSFQERLSSGQAPLLYGLSLLVVFLCLAALYESWSIPVAVLLVIPLGLLGAILFVTLRGLENDVYLQIGLLTTMGLSAKNAILMIEFAEQAEKQGKGVLESALEAARLRLRPILMTSFAFIFGVVPLAVATGAGANSRVAIGTSVIGGMITATVLAIFYIPLFFVLVRRGMRDGVAAIRRRLEARKAARNGTAGDAA
ncbi:efflux RND transporter permease subunit [Novosphingobium colocasiae]|uniref:efflux RND transporter permease subunit n=1 Tax=Novosphingobium colocasiae TaxID=1256513 RepID=UPI0035AF6170